jgi:hypothetical protein
VTALRGEKRPRVGRRAGSSEGATRWGWHLKPISRGCLVLAYVTGLALLAVVITPAWWRVWWRKRFKAFGHGGGWPGTSRRATWRESYGSAILRASGGVSSAGRAPALQTPTARPLTPAVLRNQPLKPGSHSLAPARTRPNVTQKVTRTARRRSEFERPLSTNATLSQATQRAADLYPATGFTSR